MLIVKQAQRGTRGIVAIRHNDRGYCLVELLLAMALSTLVLSALITLVASITAQQRRAQQLYMVQQEARNLVTIIQRELARAGYRQAQPLSASASQQRGVPGLPSANPFIYAGAQLYQLNSTADCITYRYDRDKNSQLNQEYFGFRLNQGGIQQGKGSNASCVTSLGWETISDRANVEVTQLAFRLSQHTNSSLTEMKTYVEIQLSIRHRQQLDSVVNLSRYVLARSNL